MVLIVKFIEKTTDFLRWGANPITIIKRSKSKWFNILHLIAVGNTIRYRIFVKSY